MPCQWDQPRKQSRPVKLDDIPFYKDNTDATGPIGRIYKPASRFPNVKNHVFMDMYQLVKGGDTNISEVLQGLSDDYGAGDNPLSLPVPAQLYIDSEQSAGFLHFIKNKYSILVINRIEELTRGQAENKLWFEHRIGRVTASKFAQVLSFKGADKDSYIVKSILEHSHNDLKLPALEYGKEKEPAARQLYIDEMKPHHKCFKVTESGLIIDAEHVFAAASSDGLVSCKCCGEGLLEIKCTYKHKDSSIEAIVEDKGYHLCTIENNIHLKKNSSWHKQIQAQLAVTKRQWCDFVLYLGTTENKSFFVERIYPDANFAAYAFPVISHFFENFIVPKLIRTESQREI